MDTRLWLLVGFAAVVTLLAVFMQPASRRMNGAQKYRHGRTPGPDADPDANDRPSISPFHAAWGALFSGAALDAAAGDDALESGHGDSDFGGDGDGGSGGDGGGE